MMAAFHALKNRAKSRGIVFSLPFNAFRRFAVATDYLNRTGNGKHCLTVDRKNNLRGYVIGNIQALTREKNREKQARVDEIRTAAGNRWQAKYAKTHR